MNSSKNVGHTCKQNKNNTMMSSPVQKVIAHKQRV